MKDRTAARQLCGVFVACAFVIVGCGERGPAVPVAVGQFNATEDQVCKITAELLGLDRASLDAKTSLGELGADELDFVELVMELEEHFEIAIPDETAERMMGSEDWQQGMKRVTMTKLASVIDDRRQMSRSSGAPPSGANEQSDPLPPESPTSASGSQPHEDRHSQQVKVFLNPLVVLLAGAERQKGRPLTRGEVLEIKDRAAFVMMSPEQAQKFYRTLDAEVSVYRMNPDRIWVEWQEIRGQLE